MARPLTLEWSEDALSDLDRFAGFLHQQHPRLAPIVAREIISKSEILCDTPQLGRPIGGRAEYRQVVLQVLNAAYVFQYRYDGARLVMLRIFHAREKRD
jgi:plasmid stabilization system protein ParE